jgi:hypothetical protein
MVDLLDNFLNPLKVFLALASDLASNQVRDEWKKLKQKYLQKEIAIKKVLITQPLRREKILEGSILF